MCLEHRLYVSCLELHLPCLLFRLDPASCIWLSACPSLIERLTSIGIPILLYSTFLLAAVSMFLHNITHMTFKLFPGCQVAVERLGQELRRTGVKPGDLVSLAFPNTLEVFVCRLAKTNTRIPFRQFHPPDSLRPSILQTMHPVSELPTPPPKIQALLLSTPDMLTLPPTLPPVCGGLPSGYPHPLRGGPSQRSLHRG